MGVREKRQPPLQEIQAGRYLRDRRGPRDGAQEPQVWLRERSRLGHRFRGAPAVASGQVGGSWMLRCGVQRQERRGEPVGRWS